MASCIFYRNQGSEKAKGKRLADPPKLAALLVPPVWKKVGSAADPSLKDNVRYVHRVTETREVVWI
jgi:hypothetical protein